MTKKRAYCKNTVQGSQRGRKYPPKLRAEVVMAMVASNNVCAVARRYKVPESTIRSWLAEEAAKGDAFAERNQYAMQVDFEEEPPFFKLSDTHYAATWLLHPNAPKVEMPEALQHRIARMNRKEGV